MKRSSTAKAVPTKRQAAGALAKLAKAHGKTEAEIELDAVKVLSRANAAEVERLRAERDALAPAAADYQQQREAEVLVAQLTGQPVPMPLRPAQALRMLRRAQAANADLASRADVASRLDKIEQAVAAAREQTDEQPQRIRVRKPKARKPLTPLKHAGQVVWPSGKMGCKALLPVEVQKDGLAIIVRKDGKRVKLAFRESGRELLDKLLTAYGNADGWVQLPKEANGRRKKIANLLPPAAATLIQHETRTASGGGHTGRVRLWVVDK